MDINIKIKEDPFNFVEDSKNGEYNEEAVEASELGYLETEEEILPPCIIKQEELLEPNYETEEEFFNRLVKSEYPVVLITKLSEEIIKELTINNDKVKPLITDVTSLKNEKTPERKRSGNIRKKSEGQKSKLIKKKVRKFKCGFCSFSSGKSVGLKNHLLLVHLKRKLFKCCECEFESNDKDSFEAHMLKHKANKLWECSHCTFKSKHRGSLKVHMRTHDNVKLYKCCECSYETNYKWNLKVHLQMHNRVKLFKCTECSFESNYKQSLKHHMFSHVMLEGMLKCPQCSFEYKEKEELEAHIATTHKNSEESFVMGKKNELIEDPLTESSVKPFKYSQWNYTTKHKANLIRHLVKHNTVLKCSACSYTTKYKNLT
ncbi:Zinc finger protein, partial [Armadillidium nasatum]